MITISLWINKSVMLNQRWLIVFISSCKISMGIYNTYGKCTTNKTITAWCGLTRPYYPLVELFPLTISLFAHYFIACVFIMNAITKNFSEDWDEGIFYLSTKFELDRSTNNGDLLSDRNHWKHRQTDTQADTQIESDTLSLYDIDSNKNDLFNTTALILILQNEHIPKCIAYIGTAITYLQSQMNQTY